MPLIKTVCILSAGIFRKAFSPIYWRWRAAARPSKRFSAERVHALVVQLRLETLRRQYCRHFGEDRQLSVVTRNGLALERIDQ
jgi:hypothetical protein